tara:strand:- start:632 stop:1447 length:816 start_codon:yes stop_codon:yes gene_type:complete
MVIQGLGLSVRKASILSDSDPVKDNKVLQLDGVGDYAQLPNDTTIKTTQTNLVNAGVSGAGWFKVDMPEDAVGMGLFSNDGAGQGVYYGLAIQLGADGRLRMNLYDGDGGSGSTSRRTVIFDSPALGSGWNFIAFSFDNNLQANWKLWVNGSEIDVADTNGGGLTTVGYSASGQGAVGANLTKYFKGDISEFALFSKKMTTDIQTTIYNCKGSTATGAFDYSTDQGNYNLASYLTMWLKFEGNYKDSSTNNLTVDGVGDPVFVTETASRAC